MTDLRKAVPIAVADRATAAISDAIRARPRTLVISIAFAIMTVGVAANWSALVAAGIAPILVAVAPCAVMCALGLCMNRMGGQSCSTETASQKTAEPADEAPPIVSEVVAESAAISQSQTQDERRVTHA